MWKKYVAFVGLIGALALSAGPRLLCRAEPAASNIGRKIEAFTLKDTEGRSRSLAEFQNAKAVVVFFLGTECPINNNYLPRLRELQQEYAGKRVQFLAINSNRQDTAERIAAHAKKNEIAFPVLKDDGNTVADLFAAQRTPEAFVLDAQHMIRYRGRIDDQFEIGVKRAKVTRNDLKEALEEVLAGKAV